MEFQFIKNIYKKKVTKPTLAVPTYDCPKERELLDVSMSSPHGTEGHLEHEDGCIELKINGLKRFLAPWTVWCLSWNVCIRLSHLDFFKNSVYLTLHLLHPPFLSSLSDLLIRCLKGWNILICQIKFPHLCDHCISSSLPLVYWSAFFVKVETMKKQGLWWKDVGEQWLFDLLKIVFGGSSPILTKILPWFSIT